MLKFLIAFSVIFSCNLYLGFRVWSLGPFKTHPAACLVATLLFFSLQLAGPLGDRLLFNDLRQSWGVDWPFTLIDWISYLAFGLMASLVIFGLVAELIRLVYHVLPVIPSFNFERRAFLAVGIGTLGTTLIGVGQAVAGPAVRDVTIPLANLPPSFDGFKIAQISDLHVGPIIGRDYAQNVVTMTNALKPDLIALTGDFVDGPVSRLLPAISPLKELTAPHGTFYVTGNHEYYWGGDDWIETFKTLGAHVLSNSHTLISRGDDSIILAGIPDLSTQHMEGTDSADAVKAVQDAPPGLVKILLAHQPNSYDMATEAGFDLQLSGHTHAGQFFPFTPFIRLFQRYSKGLNRHENLWIYVNRGSGFWGPPLRTGNRSEITLITLRQADKV